MMATSCSSTEMQYLSLYKRREPEKTPLYQAVNSGLEKWLAARLEHPVRSDIEMEFRKYLRCGVLAFGFARAHCDECGHDFLIAFSCKCRGVCPSCGARHMAEIAAHLVDHVIPYQPVRQWVLTFPKRLRWKIQKDDKFCGKVLKIFMSEVERKLRERSLSTPSARLGAVTFIQRFGSTLNVHPHFHCCVMDGLFELNNGVVSFNEATLERPDIRDVQMRVRKRVLRLFCRHGLLTTEETEDMLRWQNGGGFSLDATVRIEADDRIGLERLIRYCARPPFSGERLRAEEGGRFLYIPKKPGPYGRCVMSMTALELLEKLSALIPRPRRHRHHYHGVFASGSRMRKKVVALVYLQPKIARSDALADIEIIPILLQELAMSGAEAPCLDLTESRSYHWIRTAFR